MTIVLNDLREFNVTEINPKDASDINGGVAPVVAVLAVAGGIVLGVAVGVAIAYGIYWLLK